MRFLVTQTREQQTLECRKMTIGITYKLTRTGPEWRRLVTAKAPWCGACAFSPRLRDFLRRLASSHVPKMCHEVNGVSTTSPAEGRGWLWAAGSCSSHPWLPLVGKHDLTYFHLLIFFKCTWNSRLFQNLIIEVFRVSGSLVMFLRSEICHRNWTLTYVNYMQPLQIIHLLMDLRI